MTYLEAAIKILTETGNQPLSVREIWYKISEQNLIKSKSKKPWNSLNKFLFITFFKLNVGNQPNCLIHIDEAFLFTIKLQFKPGYFILKDFNLF